MEELGRSSYDGATCIVIKRDVLDMQMSATSSALVQMFDLASVGVAFAGWHKQKGEDGSVQDMELDLYYSSHREGSNGSWIRGMQVIRPHLSSEEFGQYLYEKERESKKYVSFITHDWKNDRIAEVSCAPDAMASYYEEGSRLPFQTSPVYFKAAVLDKYKADPDKYSLEARSISCRNAWALSTYDINEAGQVHTYIKYLGHLPYSEQLYWKLFNEAPKGPISQRAIATDFKGECYDGPDPLRDLQAILDELHKSSVEWFTLRQPSLIKQLHYPLTPSTKAWGDILIALAKLVVEGLEKKFFEERARSKGAIGDPRWGSVMWAQEAMKFSGASDETIDEVIVPLRRVQELRTKLGAHSGGSEAASIRADLLRKHKTPRLHIEHLSAQLVRSMDLLRKLWQQV